MPVPDFKQLEKKLGVKFRRLELLQQACIHRSYLNENPEIKLPHNERLEFLGDAVLELASTSFLFDKYPEATEGDLTTYRAALVNAETLASAASELGVNDFLLLSRGEAKDTGRARQAILANTYESIIGTIFLDQGYAAARDFVARSLLPKTETVVARLRWQDAKSFFQEQAQARASVTPTYRVLSENGPDHDKVFKVGLYLGDKMVAEGQGPSKQRAEQEAARSGLLSLGWGE